jgi:hypothetical protein
MSNGFSAALYCLARSRLSRSFLARDIPEFNARLSLPHHRVGVGTLLRTNWHGQCPQIRSSTALGRLA